MKFDLSDSTLEAWTPQTGTILPVGPHLVEIEKSDDSPKAGRSGNSNPQIELRFVNEEGDIRDWVSITEKSLGKVKQLAVAAGVPLAAIDTDNDWATFERWVATFGGKKLGIIVKQEDDQRKQEEQRAAGEAPTAKRNRVVSYLTLEEYRDLKTGGRGGASAPSSMAAAFDSDPGSAAPPKGDDDIPF